MVTDTPLYRHRRYHAPRDAPHGLGHESPAAMTEALAGMLRGPLDHGPRAVTE